MSLIHEEQGAGGCVPCTAKVIRQLWREPRWHSAEML